MSNLTIGEVLGLPAFATVTHRVLTSDDHLSRSVDWVHASELSDIDSYLRGGELLLTAGSGFGTTASERRGYIRRISDAGAAALVVEEAGRAFDVIPKEVVEQASRCDLPLIGLDAEVRFASVSAQAHELLNRREAERRQREREIEASFTELLVNSGDHFDVVALMESIAGSPVVLENYVRQPVTFGPLAGMPEGVISNWEVHSRAIHQDNGECLKLPILTRGRPWGWLHVFAGNHPDELVSFAADRASSSVSIALLSDRTVQANSEQKSSALITRLLLGDLNGDAFVERARRIGFDLPSTGLVVLVLNEVPSPSDLPQNSPYIRAAMEDYTLSILPESGVTHSSMQFEGRGVRRGGGLSRVVTAEQLPAAVEQAQSAAAVARAQAVEEILRFDELGIERILVLLGQGPELSTYVEDELGPILNWDATSAGPLLPSLRAFLESDGNKSVAANQLYVQRRTLYNRLDRISKLLGRSIDEPATRQRLQVAVKGLDLLQSFPAKRQLRRGGRI